MKLTLIKILGYVLVVMLSSFVFLDLSGSTLHWPSYFHALFGLFGVVMVDRIVDSYYVKKNG